MIELSLSGRHALVCGASAGIGRAAALALAAGGAEITALARRRERLEALVPELTAAGAPRVATVIADLEDRDGMLARVREALAGQRPVTILINNSGGPPAGALLEAAEMDLERAFGRLLLASHRLVQEVLPGMQAEGYGRIINVISTSVREPIVGLGVSNTIRAAVAGWAKTLARELPPGVTINNVLPGFTDTERLDSLKQTLATRRGVSAAEVEAGWLDGVPEGRLGRPEELAAVIAFLASPAASFVRGVSVAVDGGRMVSI